MLFSREVCEAARAQLSPVELEELQQEARRLGRDPDEILVAKALENLQRQLKELSRRGPARLELASIKRP